MANVASIAQFRNADVVAQLSDKYQ